MTTILHSIDTGGPGGAETVFATLAANPRGNTRHIAVAKPGNWVEATLKERNVESHFINTKGSFNTDYLRYLIRLIREHNVDLIQSHLYGSNLYCSIAGRITRTPVVAAFHGARDLAAPGFANGLKRMLVQRGASALIAVSNTLRGELLEAGFRDDPKLSVVYNGIDIARFSEAAPSGIRSTLGIAEHAPLIGALGNIRKPKGYENLVRAFAIVRESIPEVQLIIAGEGGGSLLDELKKEISTLSLNDCVHLPGFLDDPPGLLASLDVYCSSSHSEGFSLTCVEAMAARIPVVATRSGGPEEILRDRETGLLVPTRDPESLAAALINTLRDRDEAQARVTRAYERAETQFSVDSMVNGYHAVQNQLLQRRARP
ncbi:MAG: glycosyltransferase [Pseudomonadota bacterium]